MVDFFAPIDNGRLVLFRVFFGLLLFLEAGGAILTGWVKETFIDVHLNFTFIGFEWLQPSPGDGMYFFYALMSGLGLLVMIGFYYRLSIVLFTIMWTASYLMQKSHYNNHYYLLILLCGFMIIIPAHANYSFDSRRVSELNSNTCPAWCYWVLIAQLFVVYEAAAFSKIYSDWLNGDPIAVWYRAKIGFPLVGELFQKEWWHLLVAYGGITFDALIVPALLWRRTRNTAFVVSIPFHLHNSAVFQIGIFPYLMLATTILFYSPEQVNRLFFPQRPRVSVSLGPLFIGRGQRVLVVVFALHFALQIWMPLRHHFYPGNVHWTEEGHRLAWKMMLRAKRGQIDFQWVDPQSGKSLVIDTRDYLTDFQESQMAIRPDMIWQYVQHVKKDLNDRGFKDFQIFAKSKVWLNARPPAPLIDPEVDLAKVNWHRFRHSEWILQLPSQEGAIEKD